MTSHRLMLLLLFFGLACPAFAGAKEEPLPKDLPPYGPIKSLPSPKVDTTQLPNGLTLWLAPRHVVPTIAFALVVRGGTASDPKALPGLAKILAATVAQGTKSRSAKQIAEELQAAGGGLTASADSDAIIVETKVLASKADTALALLADVFQNATFPDSELDLAKRQEYARRSHPDQTLLVAHKALFGEHPYGVFEPTQETIASTSAADLRREYARRFRPDQTLLVAVGDLDPARMRATIAKLFGEWRTPQTVPVAKVQAPSITIPRALFLVARKGSVQSVFGFATLVPNGRAPEFAAIEVASAIYAGMVSSRLFSNIRNEKGYTYNLMGWAETRQATGMLWTAGAVRNEVTGAAFNEICYEMNRMATTKPEEEEVLRGQRFVVGQQAFFVQGGAFLARQLASLWIQDLPPEELGQRSARVLKVSAEDVEAVGRKYFPAARQVIVAVGEEKVIREQLAPFGLEVRQIQ